MCMKVLVCDMCMTGVGHVYFNSAFIKILSDVYCDDILFYADRTHANNVVNNVQSPRLTAKGVKVFCPFGWKIVVADIWNALLLIYIMLKDSKKYKSIYILNRLPITMLAGTIANFILGKKMYNVIHGEIEYLVNPSITGYSKYYSRLFMLSYRMSTKRNTFIVLGESIYRAITSKAISFGKGNVIVIDHPYDYNYTSNNVKLPDTGYYMIGCIGLATKRKNSHYLFELRDHLHSEHIKLLITGQLSSDMGEVYDLSGISYHKEKLSSEIFEREIKELDYSLCFYDDTINLALASGSFFDSIKYLKPILALKGNPFVDYYFEKLGNIGYQFDSISEMAAFLNSLSDTERDNYKNQVEQMKKAQRTLSLSSITNSFREQLNARS